MTINTPTRRLGLPFALTIFISAFLLFQVQPLISKYILPWFGGSPAVWTTCMLFFQTVLFAGYLYAHLTTRYLRPRTQAVCHIVLLVAAANLLPIIPDASWKPVGHQEPMTRILSMLTVSIGLPFFLLSSTGPLLQRWFSRMQPGASPYRLYALSNLASLLALVSYPFVFEPALASRTQAVIWSWGFAIFAGICALCAVKSSRQSEPQVIDCDAISPGHANDLEAAPTLFTHFLWFSLAMAASVMLLATTNQVCMDVASVPFLWVLPLTLYLISFILCFDSDRWYSRRTYALAYSVSTAGVVVVMLKGAGGSLIAQVGVYFAGLFFCAMVCHGELVRLKPHPRFLTSFYLHISAGGAAGGIFVALVAPAIFSAYLELHIGMFASVLLALVVFLRDRDWILHRMRPQWKWSAIAVGVGGLAASLSLQAGETIGGAIAVARNFYGVLRVTEEQTENPLQQYRALMHGRIVHGLQFVAARKRLLPTAYYGHQSGVERVLSGQRQQRGLRVGIVGLGVGTVAAYGRPGDYFRFYEINPKVIKFAVQYFTFLDECQADCEIVLGDARLSLEHEQPQHFDVLVLDAFSGDAIPAHLLTREAGDVYLGHLKPGGVLAVHISNLHFDLRPVVKGLAEHHGLAWATVFSRRDPDLGTKNCLWMLLSSDPAALDVGQLEPVPLAPNNSRLLWTDDRSNLFEILR